MKWGKKMTDRLENILSSEIEENGKEEAKDRALFSRIYMPQDVYQKMLKYARFARDRSGECYGYLIGSSNRVNRIIEDVYFAPNQTNNSAHTQISGKTVLKVGKEIREKGKRFLGWWHSHADID
ncbi:Mov34/MPN/PAD-1 family protein, partial [Candidatus Pacearchaeota archaeon]|nr:Mov34/MPN/PAD-1 family protein [Candidatus Pacearchaeota archaeon]